MMKTAGLVVILIAMLISPARAITLTVTDGAFTFLWMDSGFEFSGDGFSVFGSSGYIGNWSTRAFEQDPFTIPPLPLGDEFLPLGVIAQVGDMSCSTATTTNCGWISFTSAGLTPQGETISSTQFAMTGRLNVGDGYDLIGEGILEGVIQPVEAPFQPIITYRFTTPPGRVPEPDVLPLAIMGLVYVLACVAVWRTRTV